MYVSITLLLSITSVGGNFVYTLAMEVNGKIYVPNSASISIILRFPPVTPNTLNSANISDRSLLLKTMIRSLSI